MKGLFLTKSNYSQTSTFEHTARNIMMSAMSSFCLLFCLTVGMSVAQSLSSMTGPMNTAVVRGKNVNFQCIANERSSFRWFGNLLESDGRVVEHTEIRFANVNESMYLYENGTSSSTMIIDSVNTSYAGTYICDVTSPTTNSYSAELIVLESDPSCDYKIQNRSTHEELHMWCTVSFRGNWAPVMEWYEWGGSNLPHPVDSKYVENRTEPNNIVIYILTVPVTSAKLPYTCTTEFVATMRPNATNATNIPNYSYTWTSPSNLSGMTGPMNAAVIRGSNTSFQCSANERSSFRWLGNLLESDGTVVIHTGLKFSRVYKSMYSYENGTNSSTLIINSVNTSHAGTYICDVISMKNSSAELIVLESDPSCGYKILNPSTPEELHMWCTVSFRGNWAPVMEWYEWRESNLPHSVDLKYVVNRTEPNNNVTYILTVPVTSVKPPYTCTTKFVASMRPSATNATNIPHYTFNWTSPTNLFDIGTTTGSQIKSDVWLYLGVSVAAILLIVVLLLIYLLKFKRVCNRASKEEKVYYQNLSDLYPTININLTNNNNSPEYGNILVLNPAPSEDGRSLQSQSEKPPVYVNCADTGEADIQYASIPDLKPTPAEESEAPPMYATIWTGTDKKQVNWI